MLLSRDRTRHVRRVARADRGILRPGARAAPEVGGRVSQRTQPAAIAGVERHPLRVHQDARGAVLQMLRADSAAFDHFGEIYFSEINPGVVKAWKRHLRSTQRL